MDRRTEWSSSAGTASECSTNAGRALHRVVGRGCGATRCGFGSERLPRSHTADARSSATITSTGILERRHFSWPEDDSRSRPVDDGARDASSLGSEGNDPPSSSPGTTWKRVGTTAGTKIMPSVRIARQHLAGRQPVGKAR